ncbi:nitrate- and nitrite sensing domain-containing protein [Streptomyces sp. 5-8]|uniref:histidine kinase n=1 Tax=Streptomyces musisoli TaxID=2802280 RepID=A0ABS1P8Y6_9ACTN|nr:nitrate- and nitrite sensing domain-containing protein [Streptomyces musisoli]MBL1108356.1 nitrate- and nitrite sensing domain-containing protein [Streptomyces musisoli]
MQKKRPRRTGRQTAPEGTVPQTPVGTGRPTHVRTRLIVAVAVVAAAVAGAGAPALLTASQDVGDSQDLVTLAALTQDALTLAHSLADERDEVTSYIAAGRPKSKAPSEDRSARVDRQVEELRADTDTPAGLRADLDGVDTVRRAALTGKTTALQAHQAYSETITELHRLAERLAEQMPPRAGSGAYALAELDSAVQQSAAARGLLLAALNVPTRTQTVIDPTTGLPTTAAVTSDADRKQRDALAAAAQQARLRADAALADFRETAPEKAADSYDSTVTGSEVNDAEKYLATLTDQPTLADSELTTSTKKLDAALSARVDLMRGAESALYDHRTKDLGKLRDDDVTALEIRIAVLGALLLVAIGIATAMARTLTRPLSVLRRGSGRLAEGEDPAAQEPIAFTGRNDEFAQVVRSVNALHAHAVALHERVGTLETDRKHLVGQRQKMADAREELRAELTESAAQLERLRASIGSTFVNLALRTLGLVERQLAVIEGLEEREQDPERLATLFKLDHFATVMRRHSENLLVLAGTEHVQQHPGPVPLVDVVRAAVSEIERYERVRIAALPPHAHIAGFAADDLSHLLAELMENATSFSPPDLPVEVSGWLLESGEVMLSVQDEGIGVAEDRLARLNARLTDFDPGSLYDQEGEEGLGLGLYVVARLAHRHGVRVRLREQKQGGTAAVVVLPASLLTEAPATVLPPRTAPGTTGTFTLPGADAEANSNVLHARKKSPDPLITLAEQATHTATKTPAAEAPAMEAPATEVPAAEAPEAKARATKAPAAEAPAAEGLVAEAPAAEASATAASPAGTRVADAPAADAPTAEGPTAEGLAAEGLAADVPVAPGASSQQTPPTASSEQTAQAPFADGPADSSADTTEPAAQDVFGGRQADPSADTTEPPAQDVFGDRPAHEQADTTEPAAQDDFGGRPAHEQADGPGEHAETRPKAPLETYAETTMELLLPEVAAEPARPTEPTDPARPAAADGEDTPQGPPAADHETRTGGAGGRPDAEGAAEVEVPVGAPQALGGHPDADGAAEAKASAGTPQAPAEPEERLTSKGLPKRTPKITAPTAPPRQRAGGVDAEALRRRLGGFRSGAQAGYRDVEAEIAEQTAGHQRPARYAHAEETTGGTAEEASS